MITTSPVRRIADLVASDPMRLMPILHELLPKDARSRRRDQQAKVIANLPKPQILAILAKFERAI